MDARAGFERIPEGPPSKALRNLVIGFLMVCVVAATVGDLLTSVLFDQHPALLVALNARNRILVVVSPFMDPWSFYSLAFIRLLLSDPLFFILGRWYGDAGVRWMERKTPTYGRMVRQAEGWFSKAAYPLVAIAPNNYICLFAGASGMGVPGFVVVNMLGTGVRLYLLRVAADTFADPLRGVTGWITDHRVLVFAVSALLIAYTIFSERRAAGESELEHLAHIDDEVADDRTGDRTEDRADGITDAAAGQAAGADLDDPNEGHRFPAAMTDITADPAVDDPTVI